jgi:tetratricopeptide (TPR) repeat protein
MNVPLSHRPLRTLAGVAALLFTAATAFAQEPLTKAKALYDAANYEEALTVLAPVNVPEAQQYKALCMLALGRAQDASGAVELLITSSPTFEASAEEVPPRFISLVSEAKKKLLPGIARKTFNEAREEYKSGDREQALKKFDLVVTLASSAGFKETSDAEDLRTLSSGFIELARASAAPRPEPKAVPAPEPPKVADAAPAPSPTPASTPAPTSARTPAATTAAPPTPDVSQPVAIRQTIPPIPSGISGLGSPTASVRVEIGVDGRVVNVSMQQASHPLYDRLVLQAAREWTYTPAMLNGRPVPSEKVVTIQLR